MLLRPKHITLSALQRFRLGACAVLCVCLLASCSLEPADDTPTDSKPTASADRLLILCEGLWGMNNASLSLLDHGVLTNTGSDSRIRASDSATRLTTFCR